MTPGGTPCQFCPERWPKISHHNVRKVKPLGDVQDVPFVMCWLWHVLSQSIAVKNRTRLFSTSVLEVINLGVNITNNKVKVRTYSDRQFNKVMKHNLDGLQTLRSLSRRKEFSWRAAYSQEATFLRCFFALKRVIKWNSNPSSFLIRSGFTNKTNKIWRSWFDENRCTVILA